MMKNDLTGQKISHYTVLEQIGQGGMGVVYTARDNKLHRKVALKFLPPHMLQDSKAKERFFQEARAASSLDHPNICTIHEIDETPEGQFFISMSSYDGQTLEDALRNGPLSLDESLGIISQLMSGLGAAHELGITHRDVKPGNIFITVNNEVKILDFGLAKLDDGQNLTQMDATIGTPMYMSPEQHTGGTVDRRCDIWAVGVVLYEMLTGVHPFKQPYAQATMYSIVSDDPEPVEQLNPDVPPEVISFITTCLNKDPANRFHSMKEALSRLNQPQTAEVLDIIEPQVPQVREPSRSSRRRFASLFAVVALICVAGIILIMNIENIPGTASASDDIPDKKHLAILPFNIIGNDPADKAFCDGLNEILVNRLTQAEQYQKSLLVIPTSEVLNQDIHTVEEARKRFGITLAITGSFQRIGDTVRITQNLVDARTLRQLRADEITDQISKAFALQDGFFSQTVRMLNIELDQNEQQKLLTGGTTAPGANEFYIQGRGYLQRYEDKENIESALSLFRQSIKADSSFALAYAALGEASWKMYEITKDIHWTNDAIAHCRKALDLNDELSQVHITLGIIYTGQGQYDEALQSLQTARKISPDNPRAYPVLAKVYERLGEMNAAESAYKTAIEKKPDYWAGYNDLGVFYFRHGQFDQALSNFESVVRLTPDNYIGYRNSGAVYAYQKQWDQAIQAFQRSIEIQPSYSALANIGTCYFYTKDYTNAITYFTRALEVEESDYRIWGFLADSYYWGLDEKRKAAEYYLSAIEIAEEHLRVNPEDTEILADIGAYHSMLQNKSKALSILRKLEELPITDIQIMARMAETYENLQMRDQAMEWMVRAIDQGYTLAENQANSSLKNLVSDGELQEL